MLKQKQLIKEPKKSYTAVESNDLRKNKLYQKLIKYAEMNNNLVPMYLINEYLPGIEIDKIIDLLHKDNIYIADDNDSAAEEDIEQILDIKNEPYLSDLIKIYLKDIGKYNLLTSEKEKECSKELQDLKKQLIKILTDIDAPASAFEIIKINYYKNNIDAIKEVVAVKKMSVAKQKNILEQLLKLLKMYNEIRSMFAESNLRLVVSIAKKYMNQGLPLLDLINEGNIGLLNAIEKFDYKFGYKFSTYAGWWIKQSIKRALIDKSRNIRLPVHIVELISKFKKINTQLLFEFGRTPTVTEIAATMNLPENKVIQLIIAAQDISSLDVSANDEQNAISDLIEDEDAQKSFNDIYSKDIDKGINKLLDELTEEEKYIIIHRFGLNNEEKKSLQEVGEAMKSRFGKELSRERVRQIQKLTMRKIKKKLHEEKYKNYI